MIKEIWFEEKGIRAKIHELPDGSLQIKALTEHVYSGGNLESYAVSGTRTTANILDEFIALSETQLFLAIAAKAQLPTTLPTGDDPQADAAMGSAKTDEEIAESI